VGAPRPLLPSPREGGRLTRSEVPSIDGSAVRERTASGAPSRRSGSIPRRSRVSVARRDSNLGVLSEEMTPSIDFCSIEVREHTRRAVDPRAIEGPRDPRCGCSSRRNATNAGRAESASRSPPSEGASHANVDRVPLLGRCRAPLSSSRVARALECSSRATKRPRPPMLRGSAKSHAIRRAGRFPSSDPRCAPVALRRAEDDAAPYAAARERHCRWRRPRLCSTATRLTLTESSAGGWTDR